MTGPPPTIVIDGRMILAHMTGAGRYLLGLCGGLNTVAGDERIELWVQAGLASDHLVRRLASGRIGLREVSATHMSLRGQWALPAALWKIHPDLLHYPHFDLPWLAPGRVVATLYDLKYIARPDFFPRAGRLRRWVIRSMTQYTVLRSTQVIVPSQSTAQDLRTRLGTPAEKLRVIPLGVNERYFSPAAPDKIPEVRRRYGLENPFVLFVGERRPHKNLEGLLRAFDIFYRRTPLDYHLVIAGQAYSDYRKPETLTEELGLSARVHFIDNVVDFDLPFFYRAAEGVALLSYYEGFGLPVLEALACGTPVLVSNTTSLPEVAGEAGLQVSPYDAEQAAEALLQLVTPNSERQQRIALGIEHARGFTWERCARRTLEVYREALAA